jgi:hypothetical protein
MRPLGRPDSTAYGAGTEIVWRSFAAITVIGLIFFAVALLRFRRTVAITWLD